MSGAILVLLAAAAASGQPIVLYCTGDAWLKIGEPTKHSTVLKLDTSRNQATVDTFSGLATGPLVTTQQHYKGSLQSTSAKSYWFTIDRFSGEFWLSIPAESRSEFMGTCQPRPQKF